MQLDAVRRELMWLGVDADTFRAIALLPLVHVAWADGAIQEAERSVISTVAVDRFGLSPPARALLDQWLTHRPSDAYMARARRALFALGRLPQVPSGPGTRDDVLDLCQRVAEAAGGLFGFRAVQAEERAALAAIADAMSHLRGWDGMFEDDDDETQVTSRADLLAAVNNTTPIPVSPVSASATLTGTVLDIEIVRRFTDELTIGRARDNGLQLAHDPLASRHHAVIRRKPTGWVVDDLGSANGVFVHGERTLSRPLFGGEQLVIGSETFRFTLRLGHPERPAEPVHGWR